ncbi:GATA transcription factor (Ams2) [Metarhizium rileyi]|uniref:GATA transcription factor (Ams2) n=1 Tax=Metarhizium rileyi (strain RCEF 4871) TaxID=1649241 RepID=A0A167BER7_METRR|nr:GATA transcription factor (Ams2) [Metarhizium rileyi RCEF 4871]
MASPVPIAPMGSGPWNGQHAQQPTQQHAQQQQHQYQQQRLPAPSQTPQAEIDENGVQIRQMCLKVHYTFDKEGKVNCLARYPQPLQVQTVPIDETNVIGVVDLRSCIYAVMECSPELAGQESDYNIYAVDVSEPDTPLVGQGMLSWALEAMQSESMMQQPKMVTGRVTKNLLGVFGGGNRETLEVRLRLSVAARSNKPVIHNNTLDMPQQSRPMESAMTPTGASEWNTFMQSNPQIGQIGQIGHVSRVASPALSQGHGQHQQPSIIGSRDSFGSVAAQQQQTMPTQDVHRIAPIQVDTSEQRTDGAAPSSRPSSRASNRAPRRKPPTGRPRGRPRKKPVEGNTSGYEDGTEGEDGPAKKRAKTMQVERATNPFASGPESLRVAASTSGSLRTFRPILANNEAASGNSNHLQQVPRAPTPVPEGPLRAGPGRDPGPGLVKPRRESTLSGQPLSNNPPIAEHRQPLSPSREDGRSPESMAPTPAYSIDSLADIGSSPPVQRAASFLRSSPPPSSPVLPPMPPTELTHDTRFATDDLDDLFGDNVNTPITRAPTKETTVAAVRKPTEARNASGVPIQVFQMQDGPAGQDLVHICSYNTPQASSAATVKERADNQALPPLQKAPARIAAKKKTKPVSPPEMAPTPPATTDAVEKPVSPSLTAKPGMDEPAQQTTNLVNIAPRPAAEQLQQRSTQSNVAKEDQPTVAKAPRQLSRSQSAGPLALPTIPASEPAGPSSLSQSVPAEAEFPAPPVPSALKRAASTGPLTLPIPASDPVVPMTLPAGIEGVNPAFAKSDAIPAPSSPPLVSSRANKNIVKKHAIKQRLEEAIMNGEMPPYCSNCGAIETPTWRKIWVQENDGVPEYCEYSEKPGKVTAIEILQRDADGKPTVHRLVKKSLGTSDERAKWQERLLCNPCGIWLTKCKSHRPQDRWDKDLARVGQERRKRGTGRNRKPRGKDDGGVNPTSEAYLPTDALGPIEPSSPKQSRGDLPRSQQGRNINMREASASLDIQESQSDPGSTHSRGSDTGKSPVDAEFDEAVGSTKRLLFPSPRKDGTPKTLGEIDVNIVQTSDECRPKGYGVGKENMASTGQDGEINDHNDGQTESKSSTLARPSTPTPNSRASRPNESFKTPTRPTPSHRPITRSISRSVQSIKSVASPSQFFIQSTPTKTPRLPEGSLPRRSPRNHHGGFEVFDTPISRTISQMFSEGNGFGGDDLDLSSLPALDGNAGSMLDFGSLLSTDAVMPSSPPRDVSFSYDYHASSSAWAQWDIDTISGMDTNET